MAPHTADLYDYFESLATNRRLLETHRVAAGGRVRTWVGLEHIFYCSPQMFRDAAALAEEFDTGIHTHSSESIWEVQECLKQFGRRPIEEFYQRGILGPQTVIAHSVWLDDREVKLLAETGTSVAHCPCSNMKLASGPARIGHYRAAGVTVGLGTDGEKENNSLDMLEEMKFASQLQRCRRWTRPWATRGTSSTWRPARVPSVGTVGRHRDPGWSAIKQSPIPPPAAR